MKDLTNAGSPYLKWFCGTGVKLHSEPWPPLLNLVRVFQAIDNETDAGEAKKRDVKNAKNVILRQLDNSENPTTNV